MATPTIKDVANLAGVSQSTVSLVINGSTAIKPETAEKVRKAVEELRYVPNQAARSLVTREKKVISFIRIENSTRSTREEDIFNFPVDTFSLDMLVGVQSTLLQNGYSLLTATVSIDTPMSEINVLDRSKIDGAVFAGGLITDEMCKKVSEAFIPAVYAMSRHPNADYVDVDSVEGIYIATKYLIENGHKKIAFINGAVNSQTSIYKIEGYKRALSEFNIPYDEQLIRNSNFTGIGGYSAMKDIWESGTRPTAVIGGGDSITLGLYRYMYESGIRCPEDISIVGYETSILTEYSSPKLTSVCLDRCKIGEEAARILIKRIKNYRPKFVGMILQPRLIAGESVKKLL